MITKKAEQIERGDFYDLQYLQEFVEPSHEEDTNRSQRFHNSRPLDVHRWADFPELVELTDKLSAELFKGLRGDGPTKRRKHLRVVLTDLLHSYRQDPDQYVAFSRNKASYKQPDRYNKLFIKYRPMIGTVDDLIDAGYVEYKEGFRDRKRRIGRQSRIRASKKLIEYFNSAEAFKVAPLPKSVDEEVIVLRNLEKEDIHYEDDENTKAMREVLRIYNELLAKTYIDVELKGYDQPVKIDLTNKLVRRIFNSRWDQGGRFYGGWWQNVPRLVRERILIRDRRTQEIDYKGLHAVLAYAIEGIDYFKDIGSDPYALENIDSKGEPERYRQLVKRCFQTSLNASGLDQAVKGIQREINFNREDYPEAADIRSILAKLQEMHKPISKHFYSGAGLKLQWLDSQIAEAVIVAMTKAEAVVLCVHDSFICVEGEVERLEGLLKTSIGEILERNGIVPIQADLKQIGFYRPRTRGYVTDDLAQLAHSLDIAQEHRKQVWGQYKTQQSVNHIPS